MTNRVNLETIIDREIEWFSSTITNYTKNRKAYDWLNEFADEHCNENLELCAEASEYSMSLRLFLGESQSLEIIKPVLASIVQSRKFQPAIRKDEPSASCAVWNFEPKDEEEFLELKVLVHLNSSTTCRRVETGEVTTTPVYRIECDDMPELEVPNGS